MTVAKPATVIVYVSLSAGHPVQLVPLLLELELPLALDDELDGIELLLGLLEELELNRLLDELLELLVEHAAQLSTVIVSPLRWPIVKLTVVSEHVNATPETSNMTI